MELLLNARELSKTFGAAPLFQNVSLSIFEGTRLALIGPNGSGKSTLLQILIGGQQPDSGEVAIKKTTRLSYVAQDPLFPPEASVSSVLNSAMERSGVAAADRLGAAAETLGRTGFTDPEVKAVTLSGGWRKRLAIAEALVQQPDLLLLDEPTNHLDLAGIEWLEGLLKSSRFACVVVSHDRYFLENVATEVAELNRAYAAGIFRGTGNYSAFLEKKSEFLDAQSRRQQSLQNRVRTEVEWLRRGPKARATKAKARIDQAHVMIGELNDLNSRSQKSAANFDFTDTERKTKRLIELDHVTFGFENRKIVEELSLVVTNGMRLGLVGPNGSGKTTLLRLFKGELSSQSGEVRQAPSLRVVYFDQNRVIDPSLTLRRALAPDSDSVTFQDRTIHVASWASRFLFANEQLEQPVSRLSGGERARVLIARLMLEPADILLLDEPTNDLDIPTLEILEESLTDYRGAIVLVTHDRFMLDRVSNIVLGLDGQGGVEKFADYRQWEAWRTERSRAPASNSSATGKTARSQSPPKKKLSYLDSRDYDTIEERIAAAEQELTARRAAVEDPAIARDGRLLQEAYVAIDDAQKVIDDLYERWAELETKIG